MSKCASNRAAKNLASCEAASARTAFARSQRCKRLRQAEPDEPAMGIPPNPPPLGRCR